MGFSTDIYQDSQSGQWCVVVKASLTRAESNMLFLSGDAMVSWPVDGLERSGESRLERTTIFVSEIAARPEGLRLRYKEQSQAEYAAAVLRVQLKQVGLKEEA